MKKFLKFILILLAVILASGVIYAAVKSNNDTNTSGKPSLPSITEPSSGDNSTSTDPEEKEHVTELVVGKKYQFDTTGHDSSELFNKLPETGLYNLFSLSSSSFVLINGLNQSMSTMATGTNPMYLYSVNRALYFNTGMNQSIKIGGVNDLITFQFQITSILSSEIVDSFLPMTYELDVIEPPVATYELVPGKRYRFDNRLFTSFSMSSSYKTLSLKVGNVDLIELNVSPSNNSTDNIDVFNFGYYCSYYSEEHYYNITSNNKFAFDFDFCGFIGDVDESTLKYIVPFINEIDEPFTSEIYAEAAEAHNLNSKSFVESEETETPSSNFGNGIIIEDCPPDEDDWIWGPLV